MCLLIFFYLIYRIHQKIGRMVNKIILFEYIQVGETSSATNFNG